MAPNLSSAASRNFWLFGLSARQTLLSLKFRINFREIALLNSKVNCPKKYNVLTLEIPTETQTRQGDALTNGLLFAIFALI